MRKYVILQMISLFTISLYGQLFKPDPEGLDYFNRGSELINLGDYKGADSVLTLALCSFKNENVYFNRAVSRLLQADTLGYCRDMGIAANKYFDEQAENLYNEICCCKVDTIYYDKKHNTSDPSNYRYYEIIKYTKYDSIVIGSIHDIKANEIKVSVDYGCSNNLLDINTKPTDMIASYFIEDSTKFYIKTPSPVSIFNTSKYNNLKQSTQTLLKGKYNYLKTENNIDELKVYFQVYFDEEGEPIKVNYIGFFPEISFNDKALEIEKDLLDFTRSYPKTTPAKLFKQNVKYTTYDFLEF